MAFPTTPRRSSRSRSLDDARRKYNGIHLHDDPVPIGAISPRATSMILSLVSTLPRLSTTYLALVMVLSVDGTFFRAISPGKPVDWPAPLAS